MFEPKKILVVEDNAINRELLKEILTPQYSVLEAENGLEALEIVKKQKDKISLILLDIMMPVMDGYTFLAAMKAEPAYSSVPVIVTTQSDDEADEILALSRGATDFVVKPYKPQVILHRVASIISLRETSAMMNQLRKDRLTGLYSKEYFYQQVKEILTQNPTKEYDILCSDIENFKFINDIFGMAAGDRLLCQVADIHRQLVGESGICSHFNADQFACLVEHRENYSDELFLRVNSEINTLFNTKNVVLKWGIYPIKDRITSVEQMCDRALLAACSIKGRYGKQFAAYDEELRNQMLWEQAITDGMEEALAQGQFLVYLQPKYRLLDHSLAGAEALVRWNHPKWGFQSPGDFIPLFEKNGFITKLDQYIWDSTCAMLREWDDKGYPALPVSVNVSRADIYHADLASILLKIVEKHGLPPSRLHLEITESAYTENPSQIIDMVGQLRKLGFIIEMDDFGSGYSSLNMLNQLPLDILKLDMKFIQSETAKPTEQGILHFIMELARWMNLSVIAEGVETKEQLLRLCQLGCDYAQGYYFAKPMPSRDFEALLSTQQTEFEQKRAEGLREPGNKRLILVAEEDRLFRSRMCECLSGLFPVVEAESGQEALDCIEKHAGSLAAAVVSMTLPGPGEMAVLKTLQRAEKDNHVPVVMTACQNPEMEDLAFRLGADDFAGKPCSSESLKRRLVRVMEIADFMGRERRLRDEAYRDELTGLLNRRGLSAALRTLRREDLPYTVYLFDLEHFKEVNKTAGYQEGDRLLKRFAQILRIYAKSTDIVARCGGDEFLILAKQMGSAAAAGKLGEEICRVLQNETTVIQKQTPAACRVGIAVSSDGVCAEDAIELAYQALRQAKCNSGKLCCVYS